MLKNRAVPAILMAAGLVLLMTPRTLSSPMGSATLAQGSVGSWYVIPHGGGPARSNLLTLTSDGLVVWSGGIATFSGGHGAWVRTGDHQARFTFMILRRSPVGDFIGTAKSRGTIVFDAGFNTLQGTIQVDSFNVQGHLVQSAKFVSDGTRITVESP